MIKKFLAFFGIVLVLASCQVDRETLIVGRWSQIDIVSDSIVYEDVWSFDQTGRAFMIRNTGSQVDTMIDGNYLLKNDIITLTGEFLNPTFAIEPQFVGDWKITRIDEDFLEVLKQNVDGMIFFEFSKED